MLHLNFYFTIYILVITAALGVVFGSFINCMAWRIANKENVLKGRSHCTSCGHKLSMVDLIPVLSYIFRKGRCRYCNEKISLRYVMTEIFLGIVFVSLVLKYDVSMLSLRYLVLACILFGLSLVDLDSYEIPNGFILFGILWWFITIPLINESILKQLKTGFIGGMVIGGAILFLSLFMDKLLKKESLGGGDIKLFFMLGFYLGFSLSLLNLILSSFIGLVFVVVLKSNKIPFGPAIGGATWITLLFGPDIVRWYLGLFL